MKGEDTAAFFEDVLKKLGLIRVFMAWQATDTPIALEKQELSAPDRTGFTVIEWGGTEVRK